MVRADRRFLWAGRRIPLMDATSKFRVTFKEAGEFDVNIKIVAVDGGDVILGGHYRFRQRRAGSRPCGREDRGQGRHLHRGRQHRLLVLRGLRQVFQR